MNAGMRRFSDLELVRMARVQQGAMQDTGRIWHATQVKGVDGGLTDALTPGPVVECGINLTQARNLRRMEYIDPRYDGIIRLPVGTEVGANDRFEWLSSFGAPLSIPQMFMIDGPVNEGPSGIVVNIMRNEGRKDSEW